MSGGVRINPVEDQRSVPDTRGWRSSPPRFRRREIRTGIGSPRRIRRLLAFQGSPAERRVLAVMEVASTQTPPPARTRALMEVDHDQRLSASRLTRRLARRSPGKYPQGHNGAVRRIKAESGRRLIPRQWLRHREHPDPRAHAPPMTPVLDVRPALMFGLRRTRD
jgi:hypothetical protein